MWDGMRVIIFDMSGKPKMAGSRLVLCGDGDETLGPNRGRR